ncbi:hypothetical protein [Pedobacter nutrimenti]|uniref:Pectate lyase-like protein n=1 Tax=Pedobacter nutrimenti TaxID=1241337 RepID=A0A318UMV1_9SPHI|nr:hypothetical protein [Pedobacter nutrimenti]PYF77313.1 hypothetical protein B0O44_101794 [Pedobacter nutrimenti]
MKYTSVFLLLLWPSLLQAQQKWQSRYVKMKKDSSLVYMPDEKGNVIPDFSQVGYHHNQIPIPFVKVVKSISPAGTDADQQLIQNAIDEIASLPADEKGFRGALLLKKGIYKIPGSLKISNGGIVLRGEGEATKLIATGKGQRKLLMVSGQGKLEEIAGTRLKIKDKYVPVGAKSFRLSNTADLKKGDRIVVFRPGTKQWIQDLKMDQIEPGNGTIQWTPEEYNLKFERTITAIRGNTIFIDQPVVMAMEEQYGGGEIFKYQFNGRISEVGIEDMAFESEFASPTDEDHGWDAVSFNKIENSWVSGVISHYFGYSCVNLGADSKNITVRNSKCFAPKSQITGGRRYSFNNDGQLNLFVNCYASEGRHDYVTGAKVAGPNVFFNCRSENAKADIGPHHRWAMGTLYDNIITDGEINIQDRGNWGTGHGWSGVNQVLWNCTAKSAAVQNPYVSGQNYSIGLKGEKVQGRLKNRPDGNWEGQNQQGLEPGSLYLMQVKQFKKQIN